MIEGKVINKKNERRLFIITTNLGLVTTYRRNVRYLKMSSMFQLITNIVVEKHF